jgi:hypothetical protein
MSAKPLRWACVLVVYAAASACVHPSAADEQAAGREDPGLTVKNGSEASIAVTPEVWGKLPRTSVKVQMQDGETTYEGVVMAELLKLANAPLGKELRGKMLARYVLVKAADDYRVVFSLPEVDPESATQVVFVADRRDGKPLDNKEGPYRIVVSAEKKRARWVRQVIQISVEGGGDSG